MRKSLLFLTLASSLFFISCEKGSSTNETKLHSPSDDSIYFGAFADFGGAEESVSVKKIEAFEELVGKKIAWATFSQNWFNGIVYPKENIEAIRKSGHQK